jgi:hypothetical protein
LNTQSREISPDRGNHATTIPATMLPVLEVIPVFRVLADSGLPARSALPLAAVYRSCACAAEENGPGSATVRRLTSGGRPRAGSPATILWWSQRLKPTRYPLRLTTASWRLASGVRRSGSFGARRPSAHADEGSRQPFAVEPLMRRNLACRRPARGPLAPNADVCPAWTTDQPTGPSRPARRDTGAATERRPLDNPCA